MASKGLRERMERVLGVRNYSERTVETYVDAVKLSFTLALAGQTATAGPGEAMLEATNLVRQAAGWGAVTWSDILTSADPIPLVDAQVLARHITACRARMNEALSALGVPLQGFIRGDLTGLLISAADINEVLNRGQ